MLFLPVLHRMPDTLLIILAARSEFLPGAPNRVHLCFGSTFAHEQSPMHA